MFIEAGQAVADQVPSDFTEARAPLPAAVKHSGDRDSDCRTGREAGLRCGTRRVERPADMVAFIREHVYKPEYKVEATQLSRVA